MRIKNISPLGDIDVPTIGRHGGNPLRAGEEIDVDDETAGTVPGTWREPTDAERAQHLAGLVTRKVGTAPNIRVEVLCPGTGLLAQTHNYRLVPETRNSKAVDKTAKTGQEK